MRTTDLVEETVAVPGVALQVLRPRDADALLDEDAFEHEEFLPYWATVWPSGVALARALAGRALGGARVLELGCGGAALPSIVAALGGARVLATDHSSDAVALTERNAARNGASLDTAVCSWADPLPAVSDAPWNLVLAADVLYERRNAEMLLRLLPTLVGRRGSVLIADPGRPPSERFFEEASRGFEISTNEAGPTPIHRLRPWAAVRGPRTGRREGKPCKASAPA
jgi:predicted nicotinamide N-methyase